MDDNKWFLFKFIEFWSSFFLVMVNRFIGFLWLKWGVRLVENNICEIFGVKIRLKIFCCKLLCLLFLNIEENVFIWKLEYIKNGLYLLGLLRKMWFFIFFEVVVFKVWIFWKCFYIWRLEVLCYFENVLF